MWDQLDTTISDFIINQLLLNMFRASLRPSSDDCVFTAYGYLSCCDLWCWRVGWQAVCTVRSRLLPHSLPAYSPTSQVTGQINICSENAVWPPEDGRKDARNMLRNNWLTIKSLIVVSSWCHIYLESKTFTEWHIFYTSYYKHITECVHAWPSSRELNEFLLNLVLGGPY
jgi:hypothetical protein